MDSHKYQKATVIKFSNGKDISLVIADQNISTEAKKVFADLGINLRIANKWLNRSKHQKNQSKQQNIFANKGGDIFDMTIFHIYREKSHLHIRYIVVKL